MKLILFCGTTGFGKTTYLKKFRDYCLTKDGYEVTGTEAENRIKLIKFEDVLNSIDGSANTDAFLKKDSSKEKYEKIESTFVRIKNEISSLEYEYVFLDIHLSYYRNSTFFPPFVKDNFLQLAEKLGNDNIRIITLIDDAYVIWKTIRKREDEYPETSLRLREIIAWRSLEVLLSESVAYNLSRGEEDSTARPVKEYIFAIRHPPETLYNLAFMPTPRLAYLSYPITHTRKDPNLIKEVNEFRKAAQSMGLERRAVVLDPTTIDEIILSLAAKSQPEGDKVILKQDMRWPGHENDLLDYSSLWPIEIDRSEVLEVKKDIENTIRARDYKMIDQSKVVIAYDRYLGGHLSEGVTEEVRYAVQTGKLPILFDPKHDSAQGGYHPFGAKAEVVSSVEELLKRFKTRLG